MSEIDRVKEKIEAAEKELEDAKKSGASEAMILSIRSYLTELCKKENLLLAAQSQGKAPIALFPCKCLIFLFFLFCFVAPLSGQGKIFSSGFF